MKQLSYLVIYVTLALICKIIYNNFISVEVANFASTGRTTQFCIIWFFYYFMTELLPSLGIILVLYRIAKKVKYATYVALEAVKKI